MDSVSTRPPELCDRRSASLPFDLSAVVFDTQTHRYTLVDRRAIFVAIRIGTRWQKFATGCCQDKGGSIVVLSLSIVPEQDTSSGGSGIDGLMCRIVLFPKMAQKTNLLGKGGLVV